MMFKHQFHAPIRAGEVTCTVRIWKRPHVRVGGRYKLGRGVVVVDRISEIDMTDITPGLARRSGFASRAELLKVARHGTGERVFVVDFHYEPETPDDTELPPMDAVSVERALKRLEAMDGRAVAGPWTHATLAAIARAPGQRAAELATSLARERNAFKRDVRKLKALGLTESLETGYRITLLGEAVLERTTAG
jgi:hypothetical protein